MRATCGCTAPEWTRQPIPPGGSGYVAATFNPAGRPNAFTKYLYVTSNSNPQTTKLTIKGEVVPKPKSLEDDYSYEMGGLRCAYGMWIETMSQGSEDKNQKIASIIVIPASKNSTNYLHPIILCLFILGI